ncbi:MAG: hypothetical protein NTW76_08570 [Corynebacteriales bacterium]|nr:hypothetical protein [Mycobacteriales bacterium]
MDQNILEHHIPQPAGVEPAVTSPATFAAPSLADADTASDSVLADVADALPGSPESLLLGEHGGVIMLAALVIATIVILAASAATGAL